MISRWGYWRAITSVVLAELAQAGGVHRQSSLLKDTPLYQRTQYALHATVHSLRLLALPSLHGGVRRRCGGLSERVQCNSASTITHRAQSDQSTGYYANNTQLPLFQQDYDAGVSAYKHHFKTHLFRGFSACLVVAVLLPR